MFQRLEGRAVTSSAQGVTPLTSTGLSNPSADSSFSETHHPFPRPAPYDTDPRYSRLQRDGLVSRREKFMSHIQEDAQLLTRSSSSSCIEHLGSGKKKSSADSEEECKACRPESERIISANGSYGAGYILATVEDEDVCPTCLDGDGVLRKPMIKIEVIPGWCLKFRGETAVEFVNKIGEAQSGIRF